MLKFTHLNKKGTAVGERGWRALRVGGNQFCYYTAQLKTPGDKGWMHTFSKKF